MIANHSKKLPEQPSIIEFYGCLVDLETGAFVCDPLNLLIKPPRPLSDIPPLGEKRTVTQITGITNAMLEGAPPFRDCAEQIKSFILQAQLIAAHNLSYDMEMIDIEYERLNQKLAWPRGICTVEQTVHLKGVRLSLSALHEYLFSEKFIDAHRAEADTKALVRCLRELYRRGDI